MARIISLTPSKLPFAIHYKESKKRSEIVFNQRLGILIHLKNMLLPSFDMFPFLGLPLNNIFLKIINLEVFTHVSIKKAKWLKYSNTLARG